MRQRYDISEQVSCATVGGATVRYDGSLREIRDRFDALIVLNTTKSMNRNLEKEKR